MYMIVCVKCKILSSSVPGFPGKFKRIEGEKSKFLHYLA